MARPIAIVDNSFLAYASRFKSVDLFRQLRSIFDHILFPEKVMEEFTPRDDREENIKRNQILARIQISEGFFRQCNSKDLIILNEVKLIPKVDAGEAEAIAQSQTRGIPFILMDEKQALKHLTNKFSHLKFFNTLTILAILDLHQYMHNYEECIREYHSFRSFHSKELRESYKKALSHLGLDISGKKLSNKTSLSKIL